MPFVVLLGLLWLKMDDAALERAGGSLRAVGYTKLAEDVVDVTLDGRFANLQRACDLFIALAIHDFLKDLQLAQSQFRRRHPFR